MGITTLWDILEPAVQEKDVQVSTLTGKTIAVDTSAWLVEFRTAPGTSNLQKLYIKNLYLRTLKLMKDGIHLVFVLDGRAPDTKTSRQANLDRWSLQKKSAEIAKLVKLLGIPCVQSPGEAECMCAYLNQAGLVDGCIGNDGDFWCYGGKTLYRNLSMDKTKYIVEVFTSADIEQKFGLDQEDMVCLALFLGSDHDTEGVPHVGKVKAMELIKQWKSGGIKPLERLQGWKENENLQQIQEKLSKKVKKETHCSTCDHLGTVSKHKKSGCSICDTTSDCHPQGGDTACLCEWHEYQDLHKQHDLECSIRERALEKNKHFPDEDIIDEFLSKPKHLAISGDQVRQSEVNVGGLLEYLQQTVGMERDSTLKKLRPVLIHQQLHQGVDTDHLYYTPIRIEKQCQESFVLYYEVEWDKTDRNSWDAAASSIIVKVGKTLFDSKYPGIVKSYEEEKEKSKKPPKNKGKKRKAGPDANQGVMTSFVKRKLDPSV